jgi:hypothetical protein
MMEYCRNILAPYRQVRHFNQQLSSWRKRLVSPTHRVNGSWQVEVPMDRREFLALGSAVALTDLASSAQPNAPSKSSAERHPVLVRAGLSRLPDGTAAPAASSKQSFGPLTPKAGWAFLWDNTRPTSVRLSISIMSRMNGIMAGTCSSMFG